MNTGFECRFGTSFEHERGEDFLVMELLEPKNELVYNYQITMMANNPKACIIPFEIRRKDEKVKLYYNITGKEVLEDHLKRSRLKGSDFMDMLSLIAEDVLESKSLLLNEKNFLMKGKFVYVEPGKCIPCLVYMPVDLKGGCIGEFGDFIACLASSACILAPGGDELIKRIIESAGIPGFDAEALGRLIDSIRSERALPVGMEDGFYTCHSVQGAHEDAVWDRETGRVLHPYKDSGAKNGIVGPKGVGEGIGLKTVLAALASQVAVVLGAAAADIFMKAGGTDEVTRYSIIGVCVLTADLLLYKWLIRYRQCKDGKDEKRPERVEKKREAVQSLPPCIGETVKLCGNDGTSAYLERARDGGVDRHEIGRKGFIIGRSPDKCDVVVEDSTVGRIHAVILFKGGKYYIMDKHSKNGTYLNGKRLEGGRKHKLDNDDRVAFADVEYRLRIG